MKRREDIAKKDVEIIKAQYEAAKKLLEEFSTQAETVLNKNFTKNIDEALANDYYEKVILASVEEAAKLAAPQVFDATGFFDNLGNEIGGWATKIANLFRDNDNQREHVTLRKKCENIIANTWFKKKLLLLVTNCGKFGKIY